MPEQTYNDGDTFVIQQKGSRTKRHVQLLLTKGCVNPDGDGCIWEYILLDTRHMLRWSDSIQTADHAMTQEELMKLVDPSNKGNTFEVDRELGYS